ncbi:MAG: DivIVA domain-containing protein [Acidimicrobiales bacterium]
MDDDPIVISSGKALTPESVAIKNFATGFRGYDQAEVRAFLKRVADEMELAGARERDLREAVRRAQEEAANPHLDEETLTAALGEHAARLLTNARDAAASIVAEAEKRADRVVGEAEGRIARVRAEADSLLARRSEEADRMTSGLRQAAETAARSLRDRARAEAEAEVESARVQGREMVGEARAVRERMLADLTRRKRTAEVQIEHLRLARQRLLEAYAVVRRTLDEATHELGAAEAEAGPVLDAAAGRAPGSRSAEGDLHQRGGEHAQNRPAVAAPSAHELAGPPARGPAPAATAVETRPSSSTGNRTSGIAETREQASPKAEKAVKEEKAAKAKATVDSDTRAKVDTDTIVADKPAAVASADELFARLRAAQAMPSPPDPQPETESPPAPSADASPDPAPRTAAAPEPVAAAEPPSDTSDGAARSMREESALAWRDRLLEPIQADLIRHLKRVLQDEQNEVLDRLRRQPGAGAGAVLPPLDEHVGRYQIAAVPLLRRAADSGVSFSSPPDEADAPDDAGTGGRHQWGAEQWAADLAVDLVVPLRERLERVIDDAGGSAGDEGGVSERLGAGYRQWKTTQVERAARHHASAAFSRGVFAAIPEGEERCWVVDDDGPCPDCDDNALAGAVPKGHPFPTGQTHPPAHGGCSCILVAPPA